MGIVVVVVAVVVVVGSGGIGIDVVNKLPLKGKIKNLNFNREKVFEKP